MKYNSNLIKLIIGVMAISFSPLAVKQVVFTPTVSAFYRCFYAGLFLLIWSGINYKTELKSTNYKWFLPVAIGSIAFAIDLIFWHKSIVYIGAGPATFLGNSQFVFVAIFAFFVFKEKISGAFVALASVIMAGLYLLMPHFTSVVSRPTGYLYGMIVGITYAVFLICLRYAKKLSDHTYPEIFSLSFTFTISAVLIGLYAVFVEGSRLLVFDIHSHVLMALTSFFAQTLGWYLIKTNMTKIDAHKGSLLLIGQPILATVWGIILFWEPMSALQVVGVVMASGGIAAYLLTSTGSSEAIEE